MNIREAKQILNENGYRLIDNSNKLLESISYLEKRGYLTEAEEDDDFEEDTTENDSNVDDDTIPAEEELSVKSKYNFKQLKELLKSKKNYSDFVNTLKHIKSHQLEALQSMVGNGKNANHNVTMRKGSLPVSVLHPTQQEIDVNNSLFYPLNKAPDGVSKIYGSDKPITINDSPIVVYKGPDGKYYIIDGHHRWSQVFLINPNAKMNVLLFTAPNPNESPVSVLRDFQLVIKAITGEVKVSDANSKFNIYTMSLDAIKDYVLKNITDASMEIWKSVDDKFDSKESVADYIVENAEKLKENNSPAEGAPRRNIMPQTDTHTLNVAAKGMTDV